MFRLYHYPAEADIDFLDLSLRLNLEPCDHRNVAGEIICLFLPEETPFLESLDLNTGIANEEIQAGSDMRRFLLGGDIQHIIDDHYPAVVANNDSLDLSLRLGLEPCDRRINVPAGQINIWLPEERSREAGPESPNLDLNMGILNQGSGGGDMLGFLSNDSLDSSLSTLNLEPRRNVAAGEINFLLPEESSGEAGPVLESPNLDSRMNTGIVKEEEDLTTATFIRLQLSGSLHYSTVENGLLPNLQNNENVKEESGARVSSQHDENINVKKRSRADIPDPTRHDEPRTKNIKPSPAIQENKRRATCTDGSWLSYKTVN